MKKLYKNDERSGKLLYHEAWVSSDGDVVEHLGEVGTKGRTRYHDKLRGEQDDVAIDRILARAIERGYHEIAEEDHATLIIEYELATWGDSEDLTKRHVLENRMKETLGWTGLGDCDGGSIGSGTMEVCCYVVDFDIARRVIGHDLKDTQFADFSRIYDEASED